MQRICYIFAVAVAVQSFAPTTKNLSKNGGPNVDRSYRNNYDAQQNQYSDQIQFEQQTSKPVYVPTYDTGYFENPANMYNYLQPVTNGIYRQEGNNQEVSYQVQNGQEATHYTPQASGTTTYNEHERYHPTTYEHYKPHKKPQSQLQVAAASQQIPVYAYQGGESESHEGEVVESNISVEPITLNKPALNPLPYDSSYGYYGGSGIDTNQIHITEESKQAPPSPGFTYYYLGRKLWYIPLYFSIYFVIYVGALILKAVARHKILFPQSLQQVAAVATRSLSEDDSDRIIKSISDASKKYFM